MLHCERASLQKDLVGVCWMSPSSVHVHQSTVWLCVAYWLWTAEQARHWWWSFSFTSQRSHLFTVLTPFGQCWADGQECTSCLLGVHVSCFTTDNGDTNSRLVVCMCQPASTQRVCTDGQGHLADDHRRWLQRRWTATTTTTAATEERHRAQCLAEHLIGNRADSICTDSQPDTGAHIGPWYCRRTGLPPLPPSCRPTVAPTNVCLPCFSLLLFLRRRPPAAPAAPQWRNQFELLNWIASK